MLNSKWQQQVAYIPLLTVVLYYSLVIPWEKHLKKSSEMTLWYPASRVVGDTKLSPLSAIHGSMLFNRHFFFQQLQILLCPSFHFYLRYPRTIRKSILFIVHSTNGAVLNIERFDLMVTSFKSWRRTKLSLKKLFLFAMSTWRFITCESTRKCKMITQSLKFKSMRNVH